MYVPVSAPFQAGHEITLELHSQLEDDLAALSKGPLHATVVRVDRRKLISLGQLAVGVKFVAPAQR
jgi:hypothetical protein